MTWSGHDGFERRGYHHGNLREALIEAALGLIAEKGPAGFTVTEAAKRAGVSPAAPYRHFRDAESVLAEIALRGFERFAQALSAAWDDGRPDPATAFTTLGRAYLGFARREPAYYAAMFDARIAERAYPELAAAGDRAFVVLREATERVVAGLPKRDRPPSLMMALHIWSLSHGIASLFCRPDPARRRLPMEPEDLLEAGVLLYLRGLGLAGGTPPSGQG
jgi:AcrR family transcriptional regulator